PHSSSDDPTRYRPSAQLEEWQAKDPIARLEAFMKKQGLWDESYGAPLVEEINARIAEAVKVAENTPMPPSESLFDDVYATLPAHLEEQRERLLQQEKLAGAAEMDADAAFPL